MEPDSPTEPPRSVARRIADELAGGGALAVVLVGSHARGDAGPESDLDIFVVGPEAFSWRLEHRDGLYRIRLKSAWTSCRLLGPPVVVGEVPDGLGLVD